MHLVAEIIFIFLIVYLTGSSSELPVIFLFNLSFFQIDPLPEPYPVQTISYSVS